MARTTDDPKPYRRSLRLSEADIKKLDFCMAHTGLSEAEIIRKGIDIVYKNLKK